MVWCGVVWCGVVWCGVAWRGVAWRGVAWRGVACGVACGVCGLVCGEWCGVVNGVACGVWWFGVWCAPVWHSRLEPRFERVFIHATLSIPHFVAPDLAAPLLALLGTVADAAAAVLGRYAIITRQTPIANVSKRAPCHGILSTKELCAMGYCHLNSRPS